MNKRKKKLYIYSGVAIGLLAALLIYFDLKPFSSKSTDQSLSQSAAQQTKGQPTVAKQNSSSGSTLSQAPSSPSPQPSYSQTGSQTTQPAANKNVSTPNGSSSNALTPSTDALVSAHQVQLNTYINSVCSTVSGATCAITFTSNGITKSLPSEVTDLTGSAYWNGWTPQQYGLTPGSWKITATATLNGQSSSASDAMLLQVS